MPRLEASLDVVFGRLVSQRFAGRRVEGRERVGAGVVECDLLPQRPEKGMVAIPTAGETVSSWPVVLRPETDLVEAMEQLSSEGVSYAPVVSEEEVLLGLLTDRDCLRILSSWAWGEPLRGTVREYMSRVEASLTADMDLFAVVQVFLKGSAPLLPVLEQGRLVGLLSREGVQHQVEGLTRSLQEGAWPS